MGAVGAVAVVLGVVALLAYGVHRMGGAVLARMQQAAADAARVLQLTAVALDREAAADVFVLRGRRVLSDVVAWRGQLHGVEVQLGSFAHESNTAMNGVLIPIVTARVLAALPRPLPGALQIGRRVFGMADSDVTIGGDIDRKCVIVSEQPDAVRALLAPAPALQRAILDFVLAGQGSAYVCNTHVEAFVFHRDAARIRDALRRAAQLARELDRQLPGDLR